MSCLIQRLAWPVKSSIKSISLITRFRLIFYFRLTSIESDFSRAKEITFLSCHTELVTFLFSFARSIACYHTLSLVSCPSNTRDFFLDQDTTRFDSSQTKHLSRRLKSNTRNQSLCLKHDLFFQRLHFTAKNPNPAKQLIRFIVDFRILKGPSNPQSRS